MKLSTLKARTTKPSGSTLIMGYYEPLALKIIVYVRDKQFFLNPDDIREWCSKNQAILQYTGILNYKRTSHCVKEYSLLEYDCKKLSDEKFAMFLLEFG